MRQLDDKYYFYWLAVPLMECGLEFFLAIYDWINDNQHCSYIVLHSSMYSFCGKWNAWTLLKFHQMFNFGLKCYVRPYVKFTTSSIIQLYCSLLTQSQQCKASGTTVAAAFRVHYNTISSQGKHRSLNKHACTNQ